MSVTPNVSVIVPCYNHRQFLVERVESIFHQTYTNYELILLDDASTDGSAEFLQQFTTRPNVRLVINESNSGSPFAQWNRGVELANGQFIWIAESDDSARPGLLEKLVAVLESHPRVGIAQCNSMLIDESGAVTGPIVPDAHPDAMDRWNGDFLADGRDEIRHFLYLQNTIPSASAVVFRRSVYQEAGPADATFSVSGDLLQWVRMLEHSDLYYLADVLSLSRVHAQTQRVAASHNGTYELEALEIQRRICNSLPVARDVVRRGADRCAISWLQKRSRWSLCGQRVSPLRLFLAVARARSQGCPALRRAVTVLSVRRNSEEPPPEVGGPSRLTPLACEALPESCTLNLKTIRWHRHDNSPSGQTGLVS